jgi:hypothetical protein
MPQQMNEEQIAAVAQSLIDKTSVAAIEERRTDRETASGLGASVVAI